MHEIPVTRLGSHRVRGEQSHSVDFGLRIGLRRKSAANDLIVVDLHGNKKLHDRKENEKGRGVYVQA